VRRWYRIRKQDKIKSVKFPILSNYEIKIVITHDFQKAYKKFKHLRDIEPREEADAITAHIREKNLSYIFLKYGSSTGVMAHEAFHAIQFMLKDHDIEMVDEIGAYHLDYLVNEIVELALR
jgi:hypothetical protein